MRLAARLHIDTDFDVLIEFAEHRNKPIEGEALQLRLTHAGEVGGCKAGQFMRAAHADFSCVQHVDDLAREDSLELQNFRVGIAKITEHISAAVDQFKIILAHRNASFSRLILSLMRSTSTCGVLIPLRM